MATTAKFSLLQKLKTRTIKLQLCVRNIFLAVCWLLAGGVVAVAIMIIALSGFLLVRFIDFCS